MSTTLTTHHSPLIHRAVRRYVHQSLHSPLIHRAVRLHVHHSHHLPLIHRVVRLHVHHSLHSYRELSGLVSTCQQNMNPHSELFLSRQTVKKTGPQHPLSRLYGSEGATILSNHNQNTLIYRTIHNVHELFIVSQ